MTKPFATRLAVSALAVALLVSLAGPARAQTMNPPITVHQQGPGGLDLLRYGLNSFDRTVVSARSRGMGGVGLALEKDVNAAVVNPSLFSELGAPTLSADSRWRTGGTSGIDDRPAALQSPAGAFPISEYRANLTGNYTYANLTYGMPIVFFGRRAGVGFAYRHLADFRSGEETRFLVKSPFGDADFGAGEQYKGGIDAISPSFALSLGNRISLGATINFMKGTITESGDQGVTSFGQVVTSGSVHLDQDISGTSLDLGARVEVTPDLTVAGVYQSKYDLDFTRGNDSFQGLLDPTAVNPTPVIFERSLLDQNLHVPTMYGVGASYEMFKKRLTLAGDYWNRDWSKATFTRKGFATTTLWPDTVNLGTYLTAIIPGRDDVEKDAGFKDTSNFRLGAEWLLKGDRGAGVTIPIRVGFRHEPMTFANVDTTKFLDIVKQIDAIAADHSRPAADRQAEIGQLNDQLVQDGSLLLEGGEVPATTIAFGGGVQVDKFSFDLGVNVTSYTATHIFLGPFNDFTRNIHIETVTDKRSYTEFSFTASLKF